MMGPKDKFNHDDFWNGIILFGLNTATYKMALAKVILDFARQEKTEIPWHELAESFLNIYVERLKNNPMPQQGNPAQLTVMESLIRRLELGNIDRSKAVELVADKGLSHVVPRFHTIGRDRDFVKDYFYLFDYGKSLSLKDSILSFSAIQADMLEKEFMARWSLLEGAFTIAHKQFDLANDVRDIYLKDGYERTPLTSTIPFLSGYQGNTCFYCAEDLSEEIHVDHVLPRQVLYHDEIWNLVLSHPECNLLKSDRLVGPHFIDKLIARNENIMGSNHPWKHKINAALGLTPRQRAANIRIHYDNVKSVLGPNYWGGASSYNPSTDPFYKRLITALNNTI